MGTDTADYPNLFAVSQPPWARVRMRFWPLRELPPADLISNVNLVPRCGDGWIIVDLEGVGWELPGGTVEAGEAPMEALQRELMEEAGARILSARLVGAWHHLSGESRPYRPHHPHPVFYRVVWTGEVSIESPPLNPLGALAVGKVDVVPLDLAVRRFLRRSRPDLAELYQFVGARSA